MAQILFTMSRAIFQEYLSEDITKSLTKLESLLSTSLAHAQYTQKNFFFKDMSYYVAYIHMRSEQTVLLKQIQRNLPRLQESYMQTNLVSKFMRIVAISMENYDNAEDLLKYLSLLRQKFRSASLPSSRQEFESRAVLYEIINELREMLILKEILQKTYHHIKLKYSGQKNRMRKCTSYFSNFSTINFTPIISVTLTISSFSITSTGFFALAVHSCPSTRAVPVSFRLSILSVTFAIFPILLS